MTASFIGGGHRGTRRKPQTCHKSLTNESSKIIIPYNYSGTVICTNISYLNRRRLLNSRSGLKFSQSSSFTTRRLNPGECWRFLSFLRYLECDSITKNTVITKIANTILFMFLMLRRWFFYSHYIWMSMVYPIYMSGFYYTLTKCIVTFRTHILLVFLIYTFTSKLQDILFNIKIER